jgi:hypothetical protein
MTIIRHLDTYDYNNKDSILFKNHPIKNQNNKVIGKFKNEANGDEITGFVGLRAKCYAMNSTNKKLIKSKCKGITKEATKNLTFDIYANMLLNNRDSNVCERLKDINKLKEKHEIISQLYENPPIEQVKLVSKKHIITCETTKKRNLTLYDDKNFILDDKVTSRCLGHYLNSLETN